jgi:RNA polymerase sigma-32 factor
LDKYEYETLYRSYIAHLKATYPALEPDEDISLARAWLAHNDELARNRLVEAHLWIVPFIARSMVWDYYAPCDEAALRGLISAGNEGLMLAAGRFDPNIGVRFSTAASYSIRKEVRRQAKFDCSDGTRPYDAKHLRDVKLDHARDLTSGDEDREIEIAPSGTHQVRMLCIEPGNDGDTPQDSNFSRLITDGLAIFKAPEQPTAEASHAELIEDEELAGGLDDLQALLHAKANQILDARERRIYLARCLTPERVRLKVLAKELGITIPRVHQIGVDADEKIHTAVANNCDPISATRLPTWRTIDDWCDRRPKQHVPRVKLTFCWHVAGRGIYQRTRVEDPGISEWHGANGFNVKRILAFDGSRR